MKRFACIGILSALSTGLAIAGNKPYPQVVSEDRPIGYWRFEESPGRITAANLGSQETHLDGTYVDVALTPESATAALGQAAVFDRPSSRIPLAANVSRWLNATASLEFWIKTRQHGEGSWNAPAVFGADSNGDGNDLFWGTNHGGRLGLRRGDSGQAVLTPDPVHDNQWHHVVLTRNHESGAAQAYLDGRLVGEHQDAQGIAIRTSYGTIGAVESLPGDGQKLTAALDEIAIYDYVLSAAQVKSHWTAAAQR